MRMGKVQGRSDTSMKKSQDRPREVVGPRAWERRLELGCTYPSKRTVPVC